MTIKFILDETQKKEEVLVNEILETIKTKPKPNEAAKKLATFIDVVYRTQMAKRGEKRIEPVPTAKPELLKQAPIELEKKEYLLRLYNTPVGILIDKEKEQYTYRAMEPKADAEIIDTAKSLIRKDFERNYGVLEDTRYMQGQIMKACRKLKTKYDADTARRATYYLKRDMLGFRRLDPLMHDANVKAIHVEGINKPVRIEYLRVPGKTETNITFKDPRDLNALINRIAAYAGETLAATTPILDTTLNGFKIHATMGISGVSSKLTIKKQEQNI